ETPSTTNERYLIAAPGTYSNQQVLEYIWKHLPDRAQASNLAEPGQYYPPEGTYQANNTKSREQLGLTYRSFDEMLKDTLPVLEQL
ncbi:hypothetical protein FRC03_000931, partial [Tulasnella sp. 419]